MATEVERLTVLLEAQTKQFDNAMKRVQRLTRDTASQTTRNLKKIDDSVNRVAGSFSNFARGLAVGAIAAAVGGLQQMITSAIESAAALGDLNDKLGTTTDQLQGLQHGAVQANMDFEDLSTSLLRFSKVIGEAQNGQGAFLKTLRANGAALKENFFDNLLQFADLVKNAANEQDQMLLITQAFGRGGAPMLEFLKGGSEGLKKFIEEANKLSPELIKEAQIIDDEWAALMNSMSTRFKTMVLTNIKAFQDMRKSMNDPNAKSAFREIVEGLGGGWLFADALPGGTPNRSRSPFVSGGGVNRGAKGDRVTKVFNPEHERARKEAADAAAREAEKIADVIDQLKFEQAQLQASELTQQINNELRSAGVTLASKQGQEIAALVTKNFELAQSGELALEATEKWQAAQEALKDSLVSLGELGVDALDRWISGGEKLSDIMQDVAKQIAKAALAAALFGTGPMAGLFGTSQNGGAFGQLFKQAGGGPLHTGQPTLVGERGPELIVPRSSGYVVPNSKMGGGGGNIIVQDYRKSGQPIAPQRDGRGNLIVAVRDMVRAEVPAFMGSDKGRQLMRSGFGLTPSVVRR